MKCVFVTKSSVFRADLYNTMKNDKGARVRKKFHRVADCDIVTSDTAKEDL